MTAILLRIKTHYVGMETLCNVACDVYEIKDNGFGVYKKFWIDPQNGATLKYIEKGDGKDYEFELTQYSLLGPLWNNALRPGRTPQQDAHNKRSKGRRGPETSFCYVPHSASGGSPVQRRTPPMRESRFPVPPAIPESALLKTGNMERFCSSINLTKRIE